MELLRYPEVQNWWKARLGFWNWFTCCDERNPLDACFHICGQSWIFCNPLQISWPQILDVFHDIFFPIIIYTPLPCCCLAGLSVFLSVLQILFARSFRLSSSIWRQMKKSTRQKNRVHGTRSTPDITFWYVQLSRKARKTYKFTHSFFSSCYTEYIHIKLTVK